MKNWILSIVMMTTAMSASVVNAAPPSDTLSIALGSEFETLNPLIASQAATKYMLYFVIRPTVILNLENKWVPMAIKEMPTVENKMAKIVGEGMELTFDIREDFNWGDGAPMTCKDIEFTWKVARNVNVSIGNREPYENITSITWDPAKPKRCKMAMKVKKFDYFANMPDPLPSHLEEAVFEKWKDKPEGYDQNTLYTKDAANPGLYYGPYRVSEVKLGSHVIFVENTTWKGKKPFFKRVIFKLLPNAATHIPNLKSGNVQMISPAGGLSLDQAVAFDKDVKANNLPYQVMFVEGSIYSHIDLNLDNPILSDIRVRKALSHAFDKQEMIKTIMEGRATAATQPVPASDPWYAKDAPVYKYDLNKARALLDEAGWKMGPKGIRQKDGKNLSLGIGAVAGNKFIEVSEAYLQGQFKKIGVELNIKNEPARVFFGETTPHRKFDLAFYAWSSFPESSPRSTLHSVNIPSEKNSWSGQNQPGWRNADVDKWIDGLESEMNPKKRAEFGKKIMKAYATDIPVIPVYFRMNNVVIPKEMKGFRLSSHMFYESLYAEQWHY